MQRFGIRVAEFHFDVFAMCLDRLATDAKFFRDLTNTVPSRDECEHRHFAIAKDIEAGWEVPTTGKLLHREGSDCLAGVDPARQDSLNRVH